jgi:hypothetical protein
MILGKQNVQNSASDAGFLYEQPITFDQLTKQSLANRMILGKQNVQNPASDAGFLYEQPITFELLTNQFLANKMSNTQRLTLDFCINSQSHSTN